MFKAILRLFRPTEDPPETERPKPASIPFAKGSAKSIERAVLEAVRTAEDGDRLAGQAGLLLAGLCPALVHLRDAGKERPGPSTMAKWLDGMRLLDLADPHSHPDLPPETREAIVRYARSIPGYEPKLRTIQTPRWHEYHAFLAGRIVEACTSGTNAG